MKNRLFALILFVGLSTTLFAASARIKDFSTTATSAAGDDYFPIDGTTNGTRRILASRFLTNATVTGTGNVVFDTSPTFPGNLTITGNATPSTTTAGTISFDTNAWAASRGSLQLYDGTANIVLLGTLASDTPSNGQVPTWNTGGTITWETPSTGSGNVTNSGTLTSGNVVLGGGTTVVTVSNITASGNSITFPAGGNIVLPTDAAPSTTTAGTIAFDTNAWAASRGAPQVYDGTANIILLGALASDTPSNGQVPTWNTGGTITWETLGAGSGNVTNNATLASGNLVVGGGTTVVGTSNATWTAGTNTLGVGNLTVTNNATFGNLTTTDLTISGSITGTIGVTNGGTGRATGTTAYSLVATGTTATGAQQTLANGATTEILVGGGASALPVWTTATGTGSPVRATAPTITSPIVTVSGALGTDDTYSGLAVSGLNAGATIAQWEAVYLDASSTWQLADANGSGTFPAVGLAVAAYSSSNAAIVVTQGTVRNDAWNWTVGGVIYLSTTAGGLTQTAPSTSGDKVQQIGRALTADIILVNINNEYLTVQ